MASHCITLSICICSLMCSFFVLVVIYINLGRVRLYHFIHLPNCRITVLAKVPGFCPCVVSTWPLISENALIQMNGAFQMKYCMGPNSAIFHLRIFGWGGIWTRVSQLRSRRSIHYSTSSRSSKALLPYDLSYIFQSVKIFKISRFLKVSRFLKCLDFFE